MRLFLVLSVMASFGLPLHSASAEGWKMQRVMASMDVKGSATEDVTYTSSKLWTTDMSKPEIRFSCSNHYGLKVTISFEPAENPVGRVGVASMDARSVPVWFENGEKSTAAWTVVRRLRRIQTRSSGTAISIYNAVVRGETFDIDEPFGDRVTFTPPPPNQEFADFASACAVTNGG